MSADAENVLILAIQRPKKCKTMWAVARALHSEHPKGPEESYNGERIGKCFAIHWPCLQAYKVLFRKNHEASVWKIILPDFLAGTCHHM